MNERRFLQSAAGAAVIVTPGLLVELEVVSGKLYDWLQAGMLATFPGDIAAAMIVGNPHIWPVWLSASINLLLWTWIIYRLLTVIALRREKRHANA